MTAKSIQSLLDWLEVKGFLQNRNTAEAYLLCEKNIPFIPIYIHVLMGFGAFIGCSFILSLLLAMNILAVDVLPYVITGSLFILLSLVFYYPFRYSRPLLHSFSMQTALIFMLVGKLLLVYRLPGIWGTTLALGFVTVVTYFIFPSVIDRFLSCLATLVSLTYSLSRQFENNIPLFIMVILSLGIIYGLYVWRDRPKSLDPLAIAFVIFLCFISIFLSHYSQTHVPLNDTFWKIPFVFFNLAFAIFLIGLCVNFAGTLANVLELPILFACVSIAVLSIITNSGILWSIGLLMLGYGKHHRGLTILGTLFLVLFLAEYYYSLSMSLQYKSFILMASGVFLLFIRSIMKYLNWDKD